MTCLTSLPAAVNAIKRGDLNIPVVSEWAEFLQSICTYGRSLDDLGQATLQRAVISSGRWMIVFKRPTITFRDNDLAVAEDIHCFTGVGEILSRHLEVYQLLYRGNIVDTLPLVLKVSDAVRMIPAKPNRRLLSSVGCRDKIHWNDDASISYTLHIPVDWS